ncbi:NAD(P)/FAD-dependent oxidoreductase [Alicyclobacillus tolerans]|uniref:NAD(P)/FAD-dependent oxidoreductase n=1 Tax=Alicyclobacillus tolerans TaxID=90970 RepID=UPI001F4917AF|nr:NAD(P)/FAD-dependent oxidoreductase [Alicyclobacillus tolerans]MCF8564557.1 NAD(P)/FAD-dependent oxidoreductase [Alicyclobacillus tolerans]
MRVAIMGAGLSGLSCAIELERHGIHPTILERRSRVGDRFINGEVFADIFSRPVKDEVRYLAENHQIYIQPPSNINELILYSPNQQATLKGPIGFVSIRGRHEESLENQLARQVKSKVHFNAEESYEDLLREYTHVVVATGDAEYVKRIQAFEVGLTVTLKGTTVEGAFSRARVICWFDQRFAPHTGYGFLIPFSEKEATLVLAYPEYKGISAYDKDELWKRFQDRASRDLGQSLKVTDSFEVNEYIMGIAESPRLGNTLFVGNCLGTIMPLMGFGQFPSILSGIYAALDICGIEKYEDLIASIRSSYYNSLALRRFVESLDNDGIDKVIKLLNGYWGYKLIHSKINFLKWAGYAVRTLSPVPTFDRTVQERRASDVQPHTDQQ